MRGDIQQLPAEMVRDLLATLPSVSKALAGGRTCDMVFVRMVVDAVIISAPKSSKDDGGAGYAVFPLTGQMMPPEPVGLEAIEGEAKRRMNELKLFFLWVEELRNGAISLRNVAGRAEEKAEERETQGSSTSGHVWDV